MAQVSEAELAGIQDIITGIGYREIPRDVLMRLLADRDEALGQAKRLRDALRGLMALIPQQADWCDNPDYPILQLGACSQCPSCLAWQAAHDALKEVGDAE